MRRKAAGVLALLALPTLALVLCIGLGGCASPGYYWQATSGHLALMNSRESIDDYLATASPEDPLAERLALAREMLAFAEGTLDLPADGSYGRFARTGRDGVTWNVVAAPTYALEPKRWCFPVAGCVPYRGYFDREKAERFAAKMSAQGYDSAVFTATAYSTLGWFEDPILDTMLDGSDADLADTLFHELAHQKLYVKGAGRFNESYATFVGREGVRAWMTARDDRAGFDAWTEAQANRAAFMALLAETRAELAVLYAGETDAVRLAVGKAERFRTLRERYEDLVAEHWDGRDRFGSWFEPPPNNADLALVATYTGGLCAFEGLWRAAEEDFGRFHALAREAGALPEEEREAWLSTECPEAVEPPDEL